MSAPGDPSAQRQRVHAVYMRWNQLRMQLGPAAPQNEEFTALSQFLQQYARQRSPAAGPQGLYNPKTAANPMSPRISGGQISQQGTPNGPPNNMTPQMGGGPPAAGPQNNVPQMNRTQMHGHRMGPHPGGGGGQMSGPPMNQMGPMNQLNQMAQMGQMGPSSMGPPPMSPMSGQMPNGSPPVSALSPHMGHGGMGQMQNIGPQPQMHGQMGPQQMAQAQGRMGPQMPQQMGYPPGYDQRRRAQAATPVPRPGSAIDEEKRKQQEQLKAQQQADTHAQEQVQLKARRQAEEEAQKRESMNWLNIDDITGDLGTEGSGADLFGDGETGGDGNLFYPELYTNTDDADDSGLMDVLNDVTESIDPKPSHAEQPLQQASQPPSGPLPLQGPIGPGGTPVASVAGAGSSPALAHRASVDHTGSLLQHSPALSHRSFSQAMTGGPGVPRQQTPSTPAPHVSGSAPGSGPASAGRVGSLVAGGSDSGAPTSTSTTVTNSLHGAEGGRGGDQLLTADEAFILENQDNAFRLLQAGQAIPPGLRDTLFGPDSAAKSLPKLSQPVDSSASDIARTPTAAPSVTKETMQPRPSPSLHSQQMVGAQTGSLSGPVRPDDHVHKGGTVSVQAEGDEQSPLTTGADFPGVLSRSHGSEFPSRVNSVRPDSKNQQLEQQQNIDLEISKRLKNNELQAQQRQDDALHQGFGGSGESDDVAFVVAGGANLHTSNRSRRLTSGSESSSGGDASLGMEMLTYLGFDRAVDPQSLIAKVMRFEDLQKHEEMLTVPSLLPLGVSGQDMKFERQRMIDQKVADRRAELEARPALTIEEEIELRRLRLIGYLRAVRGDLITHVQYFNSVAIDRSNRVHFSRMKRLTQHDAALVEKFVNEQALERRKAENMSQHVQLQKVFAHRESLIAYEGKRSTQRETLRTRITAFHQYVEREERKRYERTAKQRLQLLRANDEEAYLKLIDQTKDARITHLLKQTNKFLAGLAKAVQNQQGKDDEGEKEDIQEDNDDVREKIDYYEVAHRVKEQVTEQPSILVGGKLKEYQLKGLQWMVSLYNNNLNGILADEMGLGKTIQSIALITYLIEKKKVDGPFLVLVPLSTLTNWNSEFNAWAPTVRKVVYRGPPASRRLLQPQIRAGNFQVLLTTYEYVIKERPLFARIKWEHMIIDEGHRMKNAQSKLSSTLAKYYSSRYRLILTGTPLQNNLPELWALLNFVLPKIFNSVKSFEEWFNKPFAQAGSTDRMDLGEEEKLLIIRRLHKVLRPFLLRRLKKDVEQDLPDKIEKVIKCKKSALQQQLYRQLLDHNALSLASITGGIKSLSNRIMQLRKLCNHPFVFEEVEKVVNPGGQNNDLLWRVSGKFELLDRVLPKFMKTGHRTLMFFQMTQIMDIMEDFLRLRGIKYLRLDGTTKADSRSDLLRLFNDPDSPYFCFLLSTRAGGLGLNLQTADTVIIYDTDWNPHQDLQAQDRAHRIGQTNEVRILRLITENSIEENILERAQGKLDIDGKVIQAGKFDNKSTSEEQEAFLRTLLEAEETKNESKDDAGDEIDDEDLNAMLARTEDEKILFAEMDRERQEEESHDPLPRLFSESELPEQYTAAHVDQQLSESAARHLSSIDEGGHHLRQRRAAWRPDDVELSLPPRKRAKLVEDSPSPPPSLPTAAAHVYAPPALPKARPGRKGRPPRVKETMSPKAREQLTEVSRHLVKRMKSVQDPEGRYRIELFLELPSKAMYPDYYQVVGIPMAVATIIKRINAKYYQSFEQFANDWRIIFRNARWYNAEGSIVYDDANKLEAAFEEAYLQLVGKPAPEYVDLVGDQPEKTKLQQGLATPGTRT